MSLTSALRSQFEPHGCQRGKGYFRDGRVEEMKISDGILFADVEGSYGDYEVIIDLRDLDDEGSMYCSCPRFDDGYLCKHLWAVILKFDETTEKSLASQDFDPSAFPDIDERVFGKVPGSSKPRWQKILKRLQLERLMAHDEAPGDNGIRNIEAGDTEIFYVVNASSLLEDDLNLSVLERTRKKNGEWGAPKKKMLSHFSLKQLCLEEDQRIAKLLLGVDREYPYQFSYQKPVGFSDFSLDLDWSQDVCERLVKTGRLFWTVEADSYYRPEKFHAITSFDLTKPVSITLEVKQRPNGAVAEMSVEIKDKNRVIEKSDVVSISHVGIVLMKDRIARVANPEAIELWRLAKDEPKIEIKKEERSQFLTELAKHNLISRIQIPESWQVSHQANEPPVPVLKLSDEVGNPSQINGHIAFEYGNAEILHSSFQETFFDQDRNCWFQRDRDQETLRVREMLDYSVSWTNQDHWVDHDFVVHRKRLVSLVDGLAQAGWKIELHGRPLRQPSSFDISVESGQDWFDLSVSVEFDGESIPLPELLKASSRKEDFVVLADGSQARIPDELIKKYLRLAEFGQDTDGKYRFLRSQAMLLDAMLDAREFSADTGFRNFQKKLKSFDGIKPKSPPQTFKGDLRDYQTEGLGWLKFLQHFQLGGCLADDMGLGKTIQVLALLEQRRTRRVAAPAAKGKRELSRDQVNGDTGHKKATSSRVRCNWSELISGFKRKPSIVVVPKSLIFNWKEEAAKFTPKLKVLEFTGTGRRNALVESAEQGGFDVLITTYGTLTRDIGELAEVEFDYAILDESQAIKNSKAQCSKASRLLRADYRLAMTGTPVENHLGELWSLFEFLNPGMLGSSTGFGKLTNLKKNNEADREQTLSELSKALQPFMLRRTKEQVIKELPSKTEQTLYTEMLPAQDKAYQELKEYYRVKLAKKVETSGLGRSKIQVLEALLRLRQVACDPRLVDKSAKPGAKLELLQQQIAEVISEGHKVLVFSQFTSFLSLVKEQFDQSGVTYEYLDGQSRKRADSVKRFQTDPSVQAFLISIKAGGHGLNLTAADYVFLLDPWWNPAVESQAIDRAHRLGQTNPVIAYRMVCRGTVEEKILDLQNSKRELADKVVRSDEALIRTLTPDDLQFILN